MATNLNKMQRKDIHFVSRHSNIDERSVEKALKEHVYNDKNEWLKFLKICFITSGVGFTVAGILFFFAYNWADLHKFIKIGLVEGLVIAAALVAIHPKLNQTTRNIILAGASILVGVLFAVYGQIYQTGANAYDFFLGWTIFVTLWTISARFPPLWMIYILLVNITFILYSQQVASNWDDLFLFTILFLINSVALTLFLLFEQSGKNKWFINVLGIAITTYATIGIIIGIMGQFSLHLFILIVLVALGYALGIWHGLKSKNGFFIAAIPLSITIIVTAYLIKLSDSSAMFMIIFLFIIASVTLTIKNLLEMQNKWSNEKE